MPQDELEPALRAFAHLGLMSRLLHVLYENSVAVAAPAAPKIVTRGYRAGERVVLEVQDDGPGVPPEIAPRIFDPLVSRRPGGSGLGLALCQRIMALHRGRLGVTASGPEGTVFTLQFPPEAVL